MKTLNKPTMFALVGALAGVLITVSGFLLLADEAPTATTTDEKPLYWVAPMDPNYRRDKPGKSPMGMALVPVYDKSGTDKPGTVTIDATMTQNLGVRTTEVRRDTLNTSLTGTGIVRYNPETLVQISPRVEGWVEELFVAADGEYVEKGEPLYSLYSPELVNAQEELILALNRSNKSLQEAALRRLSALQVSDEFIARLRKSKRVQRAVVITAPQTGFVRNLMILSGAHVKPSNPMMTIANLDDVWVDVELLERQAALVRVGMDATMLLTDGSNHSRAGRVEYVYPTVDPKTRSIKIQLRFPNSDHLIKPNMFVTVSLSDIALQDSLLVPREALIRTAKQTRVVLALGEGKFRSVEVEVGRIAGDTAQIISGLNEGDSVVTSAQFLIDSESNKSAEMSRMSETDAVGMGEMEAKTNPDEVWTTASVTKVMPEMGMVELSHEPIEAWDWPAMTMSFNAVPEANINQLKVGDRIHAQLAEGEDSGYRMLDWRAQDDPPASPQREANMSEMPTNEPDE